MTDHPAHYRLLDADWDYELAVQRPRPMPWMYDDGGRLAAGYRGDRAGDCVTRAIAIATRIDYQTVYDDLNAEAKRERPRRGKSRSSARTGVHKQTIRRYLERLGWTWHPTMHIGSGCRVHLRADELPGGRLIVAVSKHMTAVVNGAVRDTHDPSRDGTRCVYGIWSKEGELDGEMQELPRPDRVGGHTGR